MYFQKWHTYYETAADRQIQKTKHQWNIHNSKTQQQLSPQFVVSEFFNFVLKLLRSYMLCNQPNKKYSISTKLLLENWERVIYTSWYYVFWQHRLSKTLIYVQQGWFQKFLLTSKLKKAQFRNWSRYTKILFRRLLKWLN